MRIHCIVGRKTSLHAFNLHLIGISSVSLNVSFRRSILLLSISTIPPLRLNLADATLGNVAVKHWHRPFPCDIILDMSGSTLFSFFSNSSSSRWTLSIAEPTKSCPTSTLNPHRQNVWHWNLSYSDTEQLSSSVQFWIEIIVIGLFIESAISRVDRRCVQSCVVKNC